MFTSKQCNRLGFVFSLSLIIFSASFAIFSIAKGYAVSTSNPIQQENQLPGTTNWQLTQPALYSNNRYAAIEGFAWATSIPAGQTISFSVSTSAPSFTADVYRLGWYQGRGARLIKTLSNLQGNFYQIPASDPQTGLVEPNWPAAFTLTTDTTWVSGIYLIKLRRQQGTNPTFPLRLLLHEQVILFLFMLTIPHRHIIHGEEKVCTILTPQMVTEHIK